MEDYKLRLINEFVEINEKIDILESFLANCDETKLNCPKRLLEAQLDAMKRYSSILNERLRIEVPEYYSM